MSESRTAGVEFVGVISQPEQVDVDLLFVLVFQDGLDAADLKEWDRATHGELSRARASGEFRGKAYELIVGPVTNQSWKARRIAFIGAGASAEWDAERMKRVMAACSYAARQRSAGSVGVIVRGPGDPERVAQAAADGLSAAEFSTGTYKRGETGGGTYPSRFVIAVPDGSAAAVDAAVHRGRIIGQAVNFSRTLANEPGNVLTPTEFASRISAACTATGLSVDVLDEARIRALGMGLLLGVAQGSAEPPKLVVIRHDPAGAPESPVVALIGKGITFDSGGISIKPADGMERMKDDMSGGAAVAAAMQALARLKVACRVIGVIPTTENMPGGRATRPGDVLTGASGKTVEVINTDAEGRLILADALWYAQQLGATHLIDVATLTGSCMVALGHHVSGLFGDDEAWVNTVAAAGKRAGDRVWRLPIYEEARDQLKSDIADMINSAGRYGGAVTAAAFLREFAGDRPWAHLDIAGTAWSETKKAYQPKGPTGAAVRLLIEVAMTAARGDRERAG